MGQWKKYLQAENIAKLTKSVDGSCVVNMRQWRVAKREPMVSELKGEQMGKW